MDPDRVSIFHTTKKKLKQRQRDDVAKNFLIVGGFSTLAALVMFALHVVMARMLGPRGYADYGTYVAVLFTALFALSGIHLVITRYVTFHRSRHQMEQISWLVDRALKILFAAGFVVFLLIVLLSAPITEFFQMQSIAATVLMGFVLWFVLLVPVYEGALKGLDDFRSIGVLRFVESLVRFVVAIGLVYAGLRIEGAVFALGVGTFVALMYCYARLKRLTKYHSHKPSVSEIISFARPVFLSTVSIAILLNLDLLMVKHYFISLEAGVFAAASLFAKIPFFISLVMVGVTFPKITRLQVEGKKTSGLLKTSMLTLLPLVLVFFLAALLFSGPLFRLLFGPGFPMGPELGFYVLGMGLLAIVHYITAYLLAIGQNKIAYGLPAIVFVLFLLLRSYHDSLLQVMISVLLAMCVLGAYTFWRARNSVDFDIFLKHD